VRTLNISERNLYSMRSVILSHQRQRRKGGLMTGLMSFNNSISKRVLNLLEMG